MLKIRGKSSDNRVFINDEELDPKPSQVVYNHSPDGFAWGYGGSGPSQLALAILLKLTGDEEISLAKYMTFKWQFVATLPPNFEMEFESATELIEGHTRVS